MSCSSISNFACHAGQSDVAQSRDEHDVTIYSRPPSLPPPSITHDPIHQQPDIMRLLPSFRPAIFIRTMASSAFTPTLSVGLVLAGQRWQYKLTERLPSGWGINTVFKAEILGDTSGFAPKWYAISHPSATKLFELTF